MFRADTAAPWCSGLTCHPVTVEIEGSNPFGVASFQHPARHTAGFAFLCRCSLAAALVRRL